MSSQRIIYLVFSFCVGFLPSQAALGSDAKSGSKSVSCLIQDPHAQEGVTVYDPIEGVGHNVAGTLKGVSGDGHPIWGLSQWNSKLPFRGSPKPTESDKAFVKYESGSKSISFGAVNSKHSDVTLGLNTTKEYASGLRKKNERWQAFYLWQRLETAKRISELNRVNFAMDAMLNFSKNLHPIRTYNQKNHAAQFSVFLTVQNLNKKSPNFGRFVWFGLPVYDNRFAKPHQHQQKDVFTKKFIYEVESSIFVKRSLQDGGWVHLEADLLPEIKKSIQLAIDNGFFKHPVSVGEFGIPSINVGWEMPGTFDAEIQFKDLNLCVN